MKAVCNVLGVARSNIAVRAMAPSTSLVRVGPAPNHKRVYRAMKAHGLLLQRHAGGVEARRHDGRIAVDRSAPRQKQKLASVPKADAVPSLLSILSRRPQNRQRAT